MTRPTFTRLLFTAVSLLALAVVPATAFAQRGGGGHGGGGGGFHGGGGGFHGGGGFSGGVGGGSRGGSFAAPSAPRAYSGSFSRPSSRPSSTASGHTAPSYAPRAYTAERGGGTVGSGQNRSAQSRPDGQWHVFASGRGGTPANAAIAKAPGAFVADPGRSASTSRSFSGQGSSIWETTQRPSTSVVSHSRVLSNMTGSGIRTSGSNISALGSRAGSPALASSRVNPNIRTTMASSASVPGRGTALGTARSPGFAFNSVGIVRTGSFGANTFGRFGVHGPVCFRCGVGLGFRFGWGWGWGSPWLGLGFWNPFWFNPWYSPAWGWGGYAYYAPYAPDNYYSYDDPGPQTYANPDAVDNSTYPDQQGPTAQDFAEPNVTPDSIPSSARVFHLYFKNGAMVTATDFWIEDDKLHYAIGDGR